EWRGLCSEAVPVLHQFPVGVLVEYLVAAKLVEVAAAVVQLLAVDAGTGHHPHRDSAPSTFLTAALPCTRRPSASRPRAIRNVQSSAKNDMIRLTSRLLKASLICFMSAGVGPVVIVSLPGPARSPACASGHGAQTGTSHAWRGTPGQRWHWRRRARRPSGRSSPASDPVC